MPDDDNCEISLLVEHEDLSLTYAGRPAGERVTDPHLHEHAEALYILDGELTFQVGAEDETITIGAGGFVAIPAVEFSAPDAGEIYAKVNHALGWNGPTPGPENWPTGLISHIAGASGDTLVVVEAWGSKAAQEQFMQTKLGPAFAETAAPEPTSIRWLDQIGGAHETEPLALNPGRTFFHA